MSWQHAHSALSPQQTAGAGGFVWLSILPLFICVLRVSFQLTSCSTANASTNVARVRMPLES